ncbi:MAG: cobalt-precorrin-5B (C(1))-methyltransferase [Rhodospirillaceae bacterium]|jgi:cobalt-precorrin-5B (C1)-methyltransferase|nr:cobalt-precorrin-5B (C(1))-methyltransferase [Rhodospirillaceae bacterium]MBT4941104.1 cobalt-precorrin-5B (C(1))-methyltransferase [Rhodospirillaceae bacterium]MBT7265244.1 cobalt-precorrin-5B (C(1))-methyltransferase [Rhodospirillaceae bacterium]
MSNIDNSETDDDQRVLRRGWTTGACATAAAKAAYIGLLTGEIPSEIEITLPGGQKPVFVIIDSSDTGMAAVEKDAGDDPDITHGATIRATVRKAAELTFKAGPGVGAITKPGLPLEVGEPAINPGPRKMIKENLQEVADQQGVELAVEVEISVDNGEALAENTWNPRLGILGGLSILGTTGIVIPYSCSAWIASIHQGIDVARATGLSHVAACTGKTSEQAATRRYGFEPSAILDMGDFAGGTLKYLRSHPIPKLTIASGFGKISKLAAGHMDLHSKRSQVEPAFLAKLAAEDGAPEDVCTEIAKAESAGNIMAIVEDNALTLGDHVAKTAQAIAIGEVKENVDIEVLVYDRRGKQIGHAPFKAEI